MYLSWRFSVSAWVLLNLELRHPWPVSKPARNLFASLGTELPSGKKALISRNKNLGQDIRKGQITWYQCLPQGHHTVDARRYFSNLTGKTSATALKGSFSQASRTGILKRAKIQGRRGHKWQMLKVKGGSSLRTRSLHYGWRWCQRNNLKLLEWFRS